SILAFLSSYFLDTTLALRSKKLTPGASRSQTGAKQSCIRYIARPFFSSRLLFVLTGRAQKIADFRKRHNETTRTRPRMGSRSAACRDQFSDNRGKGRRHDNKLSEVPWVGVERGWHDDRVDQNEREFQMLTEKHKGPDCEPA